ncbi:hypothetical protein [Nocardia nova]|uniref:hypothetical protein n=1 Tax=Nocardia nova TaxID=37330 RepID=UPI0033D00673
MTNLEVTELDTEFWNTRTSPHSDIPIVAPPLVCGYAEIELAHEQMRQHRNCRIQGCAWKAAAYQTLVHAGRIAPQSIPPRQRAAERDLPFPVLDEQSHPDITPAPQTLREVLERLANLALPDREPGTRTPQARTPSPHAP